MPWNVGCGLASRSVAYLLLPSSLQLSLCYADPALALDSRAGGQSWVWIAELEGRAGSR